MLTISKPTIFSPDGLAARGQCNHDSPGWQLRWFAKGEGATAIWMGAFKTCRHLQMNCASAANLDDARKMVEDLLSSNSPGQFNSRPTDAYPSAPRVDKSSLAADSGGGAGKKKRRKKKH